MNNPNEPSKAAVSFANMVFVLGILFCVLTIAYASYRIFNPYHYFIKEDWQQFTNPEYKENDTFYIASLLFSSVFATLLVFGFKRLSNNLKVNLSVLLFSTSIVLYGIEIYLEFFKKIQTEVEIIAKQTGIPLDTRTKMEALDDLKDSGVKSFPNVFPQYLHKSNGLISKKGMIYPLGTISNSMTIFHNEGGYYPVIEMDEHGFNNPKGLYIENKVDIVLTGDSYTEGYSVRSNESIAAVLRKLDFNVISIGKAANGPLIELAALKEYAELLKPKIVLWLYFVNDLGNLNEEMKSSILKKYLNEDDYSQNLVSRQKEIDDVLINYAQEEWEKQRKVEEEEAEADETLLEYPAIKIIKLYNIRNIIKLKPKDYLNPNPNSNSKHKSTFTYLSIFRDILQKSKQMVSGWGGKMYFVYLPSFERYSIGIEHKYRELVLHTVSELDIPIIDIHTEVFVPHTDPLSLFPFRQDAHYNADGYRLVAESISKRLKADRIIPLNLRK